MHAGRDKSGWPENKTKSRYILQCHKINNNTALLLYSYHVINDGV